MYDVGVITFAVITGTQLQINILMALSGCVCMNVRNRCRQNRKIMKGAFAIYPFGMFTRENIH